MHNTGLTKLEALFFIAAIVIGIVCYPAKAGELPSIPLDNPKYGPASDSAEQAFMAQVGINKAAQDVKHYGGVQGRDVLNELGITKEAGMLFYGYRTVRSRSLTFPINSCTKMTLHTDQLSVNINF